MRDSRYRVKLSTISKTMSSTIATAAAASARSRADDLSGELGRANEFDERVYPVLTRDQLQGKRIAVVALVIAVGLAVSVYFLLAERRRQRRGSRRQGIPPPAPFPEGRGC